MKEKALELKKEHPKSSIVHALVHLDLVFTLTNESIASATKSGRKRHNDNRKTIRSPDMLGKWVTAGIQRKI